MTQADPAYYILREWPDGLGLLYQEDLLIEGFDLIRRECNSLEIERWRIAKRAAHGG